MTGAYTCTSKYLHYAQGDHGFLFTVDDRCYELAQVQHTWADAENDCVRKGGHLAHIPDEHHQIEINKIVQQYHGDHGVWIGLNDRQTEEHFTWTSGNTYPKSTSCFRNIKNSLLMCYNTHLYITQLKKLCL